MRSVICVLAVLIAGASALTAAPTINNNGVVNVASYAPVGLPNSFIAQGSIFVVFGKGMGPATLVQVTKFPLDTTMAGTSIKITVSGTTVNALMIYTSDGQVAAIAPSNTPIGTGTMVLTFNGQSSGAAAVTIVAASFGIFAVNQAGNGPGIITDVNYSVFGLTTAANPDDFAIVWGTGIGKVAGDEAAMPLPGDMPAVGVEVYVGLIKANLTYRGRSGCCAGLDQIVFQVPNVTGCHVPVMVKIGNIVSNVVTMAIAGKGTRVCSDPGLPTDLDKLLAKGNVSIGAVSLSRSTSTTTLPPPIGSTTTTIDSGSAVFERFDATTLNLAQNPFQASTFGTCVVFTFSGRSSGIVDPIKPTFLDAGPLINVKGPNGAKTLPKDAASGTYFAQLGGGAGPQAMPLYLVAGAYPIDNGPGGVNVGPFNFTLNVAQPLTWTNAASITTVTRSAGVDVTWSGGDPGSTVQITGSSFKLGTAADGSDSVGAIFICTERQPALHFTVPPVVLLLLPTGDINSPIPIPTGSLAVGNVTSITVNFPGIDIGTASTLVTSSKSVNYQ